MSLTKLQYIGITLIYLFLCCAHLFVWSSKALGFFVYSPLLFVNFILLFTILDMTADLYKTNAFDAKIV